MKKLVKQIKCWFAMKHLLPVIGLMILFSGCVEKKNDNKSWSSIADGNSDSPTLSFDSSHVTTHWTTSDRYYFQIIEGKMYYMDTINWKAKYDSLLKYCDSNSVSGASFPGLKWYVADRHYFIDSVIYDSTSLPLKK